MRRFYILLILCLVAVAPVASAKSGGHIVKVLPEFLDLKGRNAISPSLYERDAYQAILRKNVKMRSALAFFVQWKGSASDKLKIRIEMRGVHGNTVKNHTVEESIKKHGWFTTWSTIKFSGEEYQEFGDLIAWRATLWNGDQMVSESKSFLWQ